jgi:hypothetical protein
MVASFHLWWLLVHAARLLVSNPASTSKTPFPKSHLSILMCIIELFVPSYTPCFIELETPLLTSKGKCQEFSRCSKWVWALAHYISEIIGYRQKEIGRGGGRGGGAVTAKLKASKNNEPQNCLFEKYLGTPPVTESSKQCYVSAFCVLLMHAQW